MYLLQTPTGALQPRVAAATMNTLKTKADAVLTKLESLAARKGKLVTQGMVLKKKLMKIRKEQDKVAWKAYNYQEHQAMQPPAPVGPSAS